MIRLTDQQRKMAEKNHGLVVAFIRRNHLDFDEYYGDLAETFCVTIASYDESKGKLSTYVFVSLGNRMKNIYRAKSFQKAIPDEMMTSLDEPVTSAETSSPLAELIPSNNMNVESEVLFKMAWEQIPKGFTAFELELLNNIIYKEQTQRELAKMYNVSQTTYARWEKAIKEKAYRIISGTQI